MIFRWLVFPKYLCDAIKKHDKVKQFPPRFRKAGMCSAGLCTKAHLEGRTV